MSVLVIRANERFALCKPVSLLKEGAHVASGSLIEVSLEGCRISRIDDLAAEDGDNFELELEGLPRIEGNVRWSRGDCLGLRFEQPLHQKEMRDLLEICGSHQLSRFDTHRLYGT